MASKEHGVRRMLFAGLIHIPVVLAGVYVSSVYCLGWTHGQAAALTFGMLAVLGMTAWVCRKRSMAGRMMSEWLAERRTIRKASA